MISLRLDEKNRGVSLLLALLAGTVIGVATWMLEPLLLLALSLGVVGGLLTLWRVELGVMAIIFVGYTRFSDVMLARGAPVSVAELLVAGLGIVFILRWYLLDEVPEGWMRPALFLGSYGLVGLASLLYAADTAETQAALIDYAQNLIFVLLIVAGLQRRGALRRAVWVLLLAGIFLGTFSVWQQVSGDYARTFGGFSVAEMEHIAGQSSGYRLGGPMGSPNFYAMILVPLVPLAIDRLWHEKRLLLRFAAGWALLVALLSIVFTYSRGGGLALAVVLLLILWRFRHHGRLLLGLLLLALLLGALLPANYRSRLATIPSALVAGETAPAELSIRGRTSEWLVGWQMFLDHPLGGVGWDNYSTHYLAYASDLGLEWRRSGRSAHSLYLEIAAESGLAGIFTFLFLLGGLFSSLLYAYRRWQAAGQSEEAALVASLTIGLVGYLTASVFLHAAYPRFFWTLAGIIFAAPLVARHAAPALDGER